MLDFSFDAELVLDQDLSGSFSVLILDPGSRIHLNLPLKAPFPLCDSLSGVEELSLATEIGLLSSVGKCRCDGSGELGAPDQERFLLSGECTSVICW